MARLDARIEMVPQMSSQEHLELASLAEDLGYETLWVPEGAGRDALTQLASIAMSTTRLKLATGILPVFARTPMVTAMSAAGLASVSPGAVHPRPGSGAPPGDGTWPRRGLSPSPGPAAGDGDDSTQPAAGRAGSRTRAGCSACRTRGWGGARLRSHRPCSSLRWARRCWNWPGR